MILTETIEYRIIKIEWDGIFPDISIMFCADYLSSILLLHSNFAISHYCRLK